MDILLNKYSTYSDGWVGIGPQNVTKEPGVWNITRPSNVSDLLHLAQLWTQSTVHADDFVIDDSSTG